MLSSFLYGATDTKVELNDLYREIISSLEFDTVGILKSLQRMA